MTKTGCLSRTLNRAKRELACSAGRVTKRFFYKRCAPKLRSVSHRPPLLSYFDVWTFRVQGTCCFGNNCNSAGPLTTKDQWRVNLTNFDLALTLGSISGGVLPIKVTGVFVVPFRSLNLCIISTLRVLKPKMTD